LSSTEAYKASELVKKINWYLNGRYPTKLNYFSEKVVDTCLQLNSKYLLTTGISPVNEHSLKKVKILGVKCINFLTDDPWNPSHYAPWFFKALPHYDIYLGLVAVVLNTCHLAMILIYSIANQLIP
jgi:spore maturation protein CgeB